VHCNFDCRYGVPAKLPVFQYLGKISYGLYVYHMGSIMVTDWIMPQGSGKFTYVQSRPI
jgi:peptidoglycan/LPS O-acetylase OafA/YrhL